MTKYGPVNRVLLFHNKVFSDDEFAALGVREQSVQLNVSKKSIIMAKHSFIQYVKQFDESEKTIIKIINRDFEHFGKKYKIIKSK